MALNFDNIATTTLQLIRKRLADNVFKANPTLAWFLANGRVSMQNGGKHIEEPLIYAKNNTVQSYRGYDRLNIAPTEELTSAKFNWRQSAASISISGIEELMNTGDSAVFNLLQQKVRIAEMSLKEHFNEKIHAATATKDLSRDFLGLDELIEDVAGGSQGTLGGIDRQLFTWWQNKFATQSLSGATSSNRVMTRAMISFYNEVTKGLTTPDLIITSQNLYEHYEIENHELLRLQTSDRGLLDVGFTNQKFKNVTMMWDEHTPSTSTTGSMYWINSAHMGMVLHSKRNFVMSDFRRPIDQDARVAQILVAGNMTLNNSRFQGVQTYTAIP